MVTAVEARYAINSVACCSIQQETFPTHSCFFVFGRDTSSCSKFGTLPSSLVGHCAGTRAGEKGGEGTSRRIGYEDVLLRYPYYGPGAARCATVSAGFGGEELPLSRSQGYADLDGGICAFRHIKLIYGRNTCCGYYCPSASSLVKLDPWLLS